MLDLSDRILALASGNPPADGSLQRQACPCPAIVHIGVQVFTVILQ